mmetsp:Transcript_13814/g.29027  ORF Transcript_13814/g.29027 Transcript_13814/m.29027 type:complete len:84 (+) Transcript_13814:324-575(+)
MPTLQKRVRNVFFFGGFLVPSILVQAWVTCPHTSDGKNILSGWSLSKTSSILSMATNSNNNPSSSEEKDKEDGENGSRQHRLF